jgi:hypothetical protein
MSNECLGRAKGRSAPSVENGIQSLCREIPGYLGREKEKEVAESLRSDSLRIVSLSRARYNHRFRGRIVAEPRQAQELLLRLSLCIVTSVPFESFAFEAGPG